ncbi:unnamed protein product [Lupinus luteus]|uniref:Uncharacterized protein n=1 Tax=Lupinus luteus TaxID=3873 RepID=A0AAV1W2I3_LUPLU
MNWISWSKACRSKAEGGLGLKNLGLFNLSLLGKWGWRLLVEKNALWDRVLYSIYGPRFGREGGFPSSKCFVSGSWWWRDLGDLGSRRIGVDSGWFSSHSRREVGEGGSIGFWSDLWVGEVCLRDKFQRLFQVALHKDASLKSMGVWRNDSWCWSLSWRRNLFEWEKEEERILLNVLQDVSPLYEGEDGWVCSQAKDGVYSVKSVYFVLLNEVSSVDSDFYNRLWCCNVPSKFKCLAWRVSLWRIWTARNNIVFEHSSFNLEEILFSIHLLSWNIIRARFPSFVFSFLVWVFNPLLCIQSSTTCSPNSPFLLYSSCYCRQKKQDLS